VRQRASPPVSTSELAHGVPLILKQIVEALRLEQTNLQPLQDRTSGASPKTPASVEVSRTAALHGRELLQQGYSAGQVVHCYGDVCQAVTELAHEKNEPITVAEFHTFNRLLDNAIAAAVSSYEHQRDELVSAGGPRDRQQKPGTLEEARAKLLDTALLALDALKVGNVGLMGSTGAVLEDTLLRLRALDRKLPQTT